MENYIPKNGIYEMYIRKIVDGTAHCKVIDDNLKKSFLEVPIGDLEKVCDNLVPGLIFKMTVNNDGEDINFELIEERAISNRQLKKIVQRYENSYGDI